MKKIFTLLSLTVGIAAMISSCTGPAGSDGPPGPTGGNGVTNMTFYPFTLDTTSWILLNGVDTTGFASTPISLANLLQQANPDAQIDVYFSLSSLQGPWTALPYSGIFYGPVQGLSNDTIIDQMSYQFAYGNPGSMTIIYNFIYNKYHHHTRKPKQVIYGMAVLIPQVIMKRHPNTDWKNGNAVMQLPEAQTALNSAKK